MSRTVTLSGWNATRVLALFAGLGMMVASALTMQHYFAGSLPGSVLHGSLCGPRALPACDQTLVSPVAAVDGVPIGWFGLALGGFLTLAAALPSDALEHTSATLVGLNAAAVVVLALYSVVVPGTACLLCSGYDLFSLLALALFMLRGRGSWGAGVAGRWLRPSLPHLAVFAAVTLLGAWGVHMVNL